MKKTLSLSDITGALERINYKGWEFRTGHFNGGFYIQVAFEADGEEWSGRKWYVSSHATISEVFQTALKAVLTAEEHEAREHFLVDNKAVFGPHIDIEKLLELHAGKPPIAIREAMLA